MNRTQLSAFAAVAEAGGFTRGAEALMVSQPAVSLQVAELETALGAKLFDRLPRGVRLTAAGELLLGYARRIAALEAEAEVAVAELRGLSRGRLVVGASLTIGSYLLPAVLGRLRREHPKLQVELEIANTRAIERLLLDGRLDLAFTEGPATDKSILTDAVAKDRLVPIAPPGHPILAEKRVTAAMLLRAGLILREAGSGTRRVVEAAFARRRLAITPVLTLGSTEAIKRAVIAGVGLAVVSELTIDSELRSNTLAVVPVADLAIERPFSRLRLPGRSDSPAAAAFVQMVRAASAPRSDARNARR